MSSLVQTQYNLLDNARSDAFGKLRVSEDIAVFISKNDFKKSGYFLENTNGTANTQWYANTSLVHLNIGSADNDLCIRQTKRYFPYYPGKSHQVIMTGIFDEAKTNNVQRIGTFDDDNGLFFEMNENGIAVGVRTSTSGTPVDTIISRSNWNISKLDGTGNFKQIVDFTKMNIFVIDFQWLGTGRIRFGLNLDGFTYYIHEISNYSVREFPWSVSATLPVRFENRNIGASTSSTLKEGCTVVSYEGSERTPISSYTISNGSTLKAITTRAPLMAIRLKNSFNTKENKVSMKYAGCGAFSDGETTYIEVVKYSGNVSYSGTWANVHIESAVEYSTDISGISSDSNILITSFYLPATSQGSNINPSTYVADADKLNENYFGNQNINSSNSDIFVVYATSLNTATNTGCVLNWDEIY